jgi:hypothetical protein
MPGRERTIHPARFERAISGFVDGRSILTELRAHFKGSGGTYEATQGSQVSLGPKQEADTPRL